MKCPKICARSKADKIKNIKQSRGLKKLNQKMIQQQDEGNSHIAKTQVRPCPLPETNTTFYRDVLPIVTETACVLVSAVYDHIGKCQCYERPLLYLHYFMQSLFICFYWFYWLFLLADVSIYYCKTLCNAESYTCRWWETVVELFVDSNCKPGWG